MATGGALADPGTLYADPAQVAAALQAARAGARVTYAYGWPLDRGNPVVRLVEKLSGSGLVKLHQNGRDALGRAINVAQRLDSSKGSPSAGSPAAADGDTALGSSGRPLEARLREAGFAGKALAQAAKVVRLIEAAARAGKACPSYAGLADAADLRDRERARYLIRQLTTAKVLTVWSRARTGLVVGIVGTRLQTAEPDAPVLRQAQDDRFKSEIKRVFGA